MIDNSHEPAGFEYAMLVCPLRTLADPVYTLYINNEIVARYGTRLDDAMNKLDKQGWVIDCLISTAPETIRILLRRTSS